ncbi:histone-lysine N-methyltransferase SETMAR-like [Tetranychus urticae]|uniref:histone-lysine N-methyltransferase SETMAR-like n=1 Tax=Tetranychus urticae TaxID=32264 RepID=UPI00077B96EE|nr:histone-lysine N-methyltransferase SETMAR-like [Tetranychus urticae]
MDKVQKLKELTSVRDQKVIIRFLWISQESSGVIHSKLVKIFGGQAISKKAIESCIKRFNKGDLDIEEHRSGTSKGRDVREERLTVIEDALADSRHWSTRSLAAKVSIPLTTVKAYLNDRLKLRKRLGKWVPHDLSETNKENRVLSCRLALQMIRDDPDCLKKTVTIDETWVSLYMAPDRNQQRQWVYPGEEPEPVTKENIHGNKRMLIMGVDWNGIAFWELLPEKTTVTADVYKSFLVDKLPVWINENKHQRPYLLHDNARPHKAAPVVQLLERKGITIWPHPAYSPDISPLDFNCFGQLKRHLRGIKHANWTEFETALVEAVEDLNSKNLIQGVRMLPERWKRVIECNGDYI